MVHGTNGPGLLTGVPCSMLVGYVLIPHRIRVLLFCWCRLFCGNSKWDSKRPMNSLTVHTSFFSLTLGSNASPGPGATHAQDAPPCSWCWWLLQDDLHLPQHRRGVEHQPVLTKRLSDRARYTVRYGWGTDILDNLSVWEFSLNPPSTPKGGAAHVVQGLLRQGHLELNHASRGEAPLYFFFLKIWLPASLISNWRSM